MSEQITRLQKSRNAYKSHVTRQFKKVDELMANDKLDELVLSSLRTTQELLIKKKETIHQLDTQIIELTTDGDALEDEILESEEIQDGILEKVNLIDTFIRMQSRIHTPESSVASSLTPAVVPPPSTSEVASPSPVIPQPPISSQSSTTADSVNPLHVSSPSATSHDSTTVTTNITTPIVSNQVYHTSRLPKLELPTFSGDPLTWQSFWDSFDAAVNSNPTLSPIHKFNYLKAQLHGDAVRAISGFPLTESNYEQSITLLKQRFGQPEKLINAHTHALIELPGPTNDLSSLQLFHDTTENHIRGLESLGVSKESYSTLLVPIILGKLPPSVRSNLARDNDRAKWTLDDLQTAVLKEVRVLECGQYVTTFPSSTSTRPKATASFIAAIKGGRQSTSAAKKKPQCIYCKGEHSPTSCSEITDHQKRLDIVRKASLCFNCLGNHKISQCNSKFRCKHCRHKHHTSLCKPADISPQPTTQGSTPPVQPVNQSQISPTTQSSQVGAHAAPVLRDPSQVTISLLKTAIAPVIGGGVRIHSNILFDEGSQRSFITEETANKLKLSRVKTENVAIAPFGAEYSTPQPTSVGQVHIETSSGDKIPISVLIVPFIAAPLKNTLQRSIDNFPYLRELRLAHPITSEHNFQVSILIGADYYWTFVEDKIIRGDGPTAQQSKLGFLLSGPMCSPTLQLNIATMHVTTCEEPDLERFWSIEEAGTTPTKSEQIDTTFIHHYQSACITQATDGTYTAQFPWKPVHQPLPSNFTTCERRTRQLISHLTQNPTLLHLYHSIIIDQEARGFIEKVPSTDSTAKIHYLPHHPVKKDSTTTPIRIVYDCSSRQSKEHASLNDCLLVGPPFLNDLCSIILRFRLHKFAFATDLEKAFLHVRLHESDRDTTRFLWVSDINTPHGALITYRFKVVPFGTSSSPFMLNATLDLHLKKFSSSVARDMTSNLYVDNLISGCKSEQELLDYYNLSRSIMNQANFNLRSWSSNSHKLRALAEREQTNDSSICVNLLGLRWNTLDDTIGLTSKSFISLTSSPLVTKRQILRDSAQIYDPLGLITPITVRAKLLLQALWKQKVDWDEPVDQESHDKWHRIATDIHEVTTYVYPRPYFTQHTYPITSRQIHVFADASLLAYGAVAYLQHNNQATLVMSRSRVAPVKSITLPKLELMAAVIATRLTKFVIASLYLTPDDTTVHLWSDSQITLHWIYDIKQITPTKPFIANRVTEITQSFPASVWTYVPTDDNPADLLTRGISATQLKSSQLWLHGPSWLTSTEQWPTWSPTNVLHLQNIDLDDIPEVKDKPTNPTKTCGIHLVIDASRYSRLNKLLFITTHVLRFCHNLRHSQDKVTGPITARELSDSTMIWIKTSQQLEYFDEITNLKSQSHKRTQLVRQLRLFLDGKGFLRCGGRIHNAPISELAKFPYLLAPNHHITKLIVYATHERIHHSGVNSTVTAIRQLYWIPAIRVFVRKLLRKCVTCVRLTGKPYRLPDPPPLPKTRTEDPTPFSVCGVDFTGAMYVREGDNERKVYICLFTCATTRAVHLEVVLDMTVESFMLAFRKFVGRRSLPRTMISDNASTYLAAADELQLLLNSTSLKQALEGHGVTWQFIPKRAPWHGGFWERLVGLTKQALKKTLGRSFVTLQILETIVVEVEATLNDRPLTYVSSDVADVEPLTPAHLLYGKRMTSLPHSYDEVPDDPDYVVSETRMRRQVTNHARLLQHFQTRWKKEYLTSLREFHKASGTNMQNVRVGDVVLIHDDGPRLHWRLGVIDSLIQGNDGFTRSVNVRTSNRVTSRPISRLYPLEISHPPSDHDSSDHSSPIEPTTQNNDNERNDRPRREAARKARTRLLEWAAKLTRAPEDVEN